MLLLQKNVVEDDAKISSGQINLLRAPHHTLSLSI